MSQLESGNHNELEVLAYAPPQSQFAQPLDYIFAEHFRQRVLCNVLELIANGDRPDRRLVAASIKFLRNDFAPHIQDEEQDLFPLLRRRAEPEDRVDQLISQLSEEHASDKLDVQDIVNGLQALLRRTVSVQSSFARLLRRFVANERHHLTVENAIILPLARLRLTHDDLLTLGHRMAERRGETFPETANAV
jgi:hemerythrin-like domain-containing protein